MMPSDSMPKFLHYPENRADIVAYRKDATVEAVVTIARVHYDEGRQWADKGDNVKLSAADAKLLESLDQVRVVATK